MALLSLLVILSSLPHLFATDTDPYTNFQKLDLPPSTRGGPIGPTSVALDSLGQGPYVGVSDGRILKYGGSADVGFLDFAYTSPNRTKQSCDGVTNVNSTASCGRPVGFSFHNFLTLSLLNIPIRIEELYIVDGYNGLFKVGSGGGKAEFITNTAGNATFSLLDGIDVDPNTDDVYFTDGSEIYNLRDFEQAQKNIPDATGRLLRYCPTTGEVEVVLDGLISPAGPAVSHDGSFVVFSDLFNGTIQKYDLTLPKSSTNPKPLLPLDVTPVYIKRASTPGEFWVAANKNFVNDQSVVSPFGYKFSSNGTILIKKAFGAEFGNLTVAVVQEYNNQVLYVGADQANFVGVYTTNTTVAMN